MGILADTIRATAGIDTTPAKDTTPEAFSKSLRAGTLGAGAQLQALAGGVAEAAGADEFAKARYAGARDLSLRAQEAMPQITSYHDVHNVSDALRYGAGMVGQSLPSMVAGGAAALATRGGAIPSLLSATAAQAPLEIGDVIQRQQQDPAQAEASAADRLQAAALAGTGSAALQSVVPAIMGGKLLGRTAATAAKQSAGKIIGRGAADAALEGVTEGAGEAVKQGGEMLLNPNKQLDTDAIAENAVGGLAGGVAMGGLGTAGELAHAKGEQVKGLVGRAASAATTGTKGLVGRAKDAAADGATALQDAAQGIDLNAPREAAAGLVGRAKAAVQGDDGGFDLGATKDNAQNAVGRAAEGVVNVFRNAKDQTSEWVDRVANNEEFMDAKRFAGAQGDKLKALIGQENQDRLAKVQEWGRDALAQAKDPATREKLQAALSTAGDTASQAFIASTKKALQATNYSKAAIEGLTASLKGALDGGAKKSADYAGVDKVIRETVAPMLAERAPHLMGDSQSINKLASGLRGVIGEMAGGKPLSVDTYMNLLSVTGEHTAEILDKVHSAIGQTDPDKVDAFFSGVNALNDVQAGRTKLIDVMRSSLPDGQHVDDQTLDQAARGLVQWANTTPDAGSPARQRFHDERVKSELKQWFGKKADAVLEAAHALVKTAENQVEKARVKTDEEGNPLGEEGGDYGGMELAGSGTKLAVYGKKLLLNADDDPGKAGFRPAITQAVEKAQAANPHRTVRYASAEEMGADHPLVKAKHDELVKEGLARDLTLEEARKYADGELGKYGAAVSEESDAPTAYTADELDGLKLDAKAHSRSPSRVQAGNLVLDAVKMTESMHSRLKSQASYSPSENVNVRARDAHMFMEAVAATQDYLGKTFDIPDGTVISKSGLTWGEAKKLDLRTDEDKANDNDAKTLESMRAAYKKADASKKKKIAEDASKIIGRKQFAKDRELTADDNRQEITDKANFDGQVERGIDVAKGKLKEQLAEAQDKIAEFGETHGYTPESPELQAQLRALIADFQAVKARLDARKITDLGTGRTEIDPFGPTLDATRGTDEGAPINTDSGEKRGPILPMKITPPATSDPRANKGVLKSGAAMSTESVDKMILAEDNSGLTTRKQVDEFLAAARRRYTELKALDQQLEQRGEFLPAAQEKVLQATMRWFGPDSKVDFDSFYDAVEGAPRPKAAAAKKAAFLERARSGDQALIDEVSQSNDVKGLQRAIDALLGAGLHGDVLAAANARMAELVANPDVAYSLLTPKYDATTVSPGTAGPRDVAAALSYIRKVLGNSVQVETNAAILHAGEFRAAWQGNPNDVIRLSAHALNPTTVAYHEALHAFMAKLMRQGNGEVAEVLMQAAESPTVMLQLRRLLADRPEALAQLHDAEERAAYMYQFWAAGELRVTDRATSLFGRITEFVRSLLGVWSNDERALHILEYFHQGEFAKNMATPSAVAEALMAPGRNQALESFKAMVQPLTDVGEKLAVAGHQRLRDTGIPALRELADLMKLSGTAEGDDPGFLPAARMQRSRMMNDLGAALHGMKSEALTAAMESMQRGNDPAVIAALGTPEARSEARLAVKAIRRSLDAAFHYMQQAGVAVNDLGVGKDYFPRIWDASRISGQQAEFLAMLERYRQSGELQMDPRELMKRLMVTDGAELTPEVDRPGMQHLKPRELAFIKPEDAAPFVRKNLYETMNSYLTQAARRAEWARRFSDDGTKLSALLTRAETQGATKDDLDAARKYVRAVDGTLGDGINPEWRRLQGNLIVYQNIRLLPLAIFSSVVDPVGIMVRGGTVGEAFDAFKRGVAGIAKNFKHDPNPDAAEELAAALGTIDSVSLAHTLGTSFNQGMVGDRARKINDLFFRFNLMEQFNTDMRVMATQSAVNFLKRHADGTRSAHSPRWLAELGLEPGEVQLDAQGHVRLTEDDGLTAEQAAKMRVAVNRWVDGAVLRPDAADKPIWMNDPHFALLSHLKQFVFSFHETILKRVAHELRHGNLTPAYALASYVPVMAAADAAKGIIQGGGSEPAWKREWGASDYLWSGVERAGLLGVGQFGVDALHSVQRGETGIGRLLGPTVEQLGEAVQVVGGREQFSAFALHSMPANALYAGGLRTAPAESAHTE